MTEQEKRADFFSCTGRLASVDDHCYFCYLAGQASVEQYGPEDLYTENDQLKIRVAELEQRLHEVSLDWQVQDAALKAQAGEPYRYIYTTNGLYEWCVKAKPPEDAYDEGSLVPLYAAPPDAPAQIAELKALNARLLIEYEQRMEQIDALKAQAGDSKEKAWNPTDAEMASLLGREGENYAYLRTTHPTTEPVKAQAGEPVAWIYQDKNTGKIYTQLLRPNVPTEQPLFTHPTTERRVIPEEPEWITKLRHELMMSKITHNFTFNRDETIALLNAAPAPTKED